MESIDDTSAAGVPCLAACLAGCLVCLADSVIVVADVVTGGVAMAGASAA